MPARALPSLGRIAAAAVLLALGAAWSEASAARWGADYFPNLPVVTQDGRTVRFYDDLVRGKIVVINFVYTSCPDICSLSTSRMAWVQDQLGDRLGREIFIYSITIDPENDTPAVLKEYAEAFDAQPGWLFLTGKPEDIREIRFKLGERSRTLGEHRSDMVLGNAVTGEWRRTSLMGNLVILTREILAMDPAYRPPRRIPSAADFTVKPDALEIGDHRGEALFLKGCASCHTIGEGKRIGPDLMGVLDRRDRDWLVRFIMDPDGMRARGDRTAIEIDARFPGVSMPDLGLSEDDAGDVLSYIASRTGQFTRAVDEATVVEMASHEEQTHHHHDSEHHTHGGNDLSEQP